MNYVCDHCGRGFERRKSTARWHFCSRACLNQARKRGGVIAISRQHVFKRACLTCGDEFAFTRHNKHQQYCNKACAGVARRTGGAIAQKVDSTTLKNHGVRRMFQDVERIKQCLMQRYGVEYASQIPGMARENWRKAHATKKRNGTYVVSKVEREFCTSLEIHGIAYEVQIEMFGRPIDVKVGEIYVQVDGEYWHGLDRPIAEIQASNYARDATIYKRWLADREQDRQFVEAGLTLVRLTDKEVREWLKQEKNPQLLINERVMKLMS